MPLDRSGLHNSISSSEDVNAPGMSRRLARRCARSARSAFCLSTQSSSPPLSFDIPFHCVADVVRHIVANVNRPTHLMTCNDAALRVAPAAPEPASAHQNGFLSERRSKSHIYFDAATKLTCECQLTSRTHGRTRAGVISCGSGLDGSSAMGNVYERSSTCTILPSKDQI